MASGLENMWENCAPVPVIGPLLVAALLAGLSKVMPRWLTDVVGILTAAGSVAVSAVLGWQTRAEPLVYWFGGWHPNGAHFPVGIGFVIDPLAAGMSALAAFLVLCALVFSWKHFKSVKTLYHVMMLVFMGAMSGMCLTGDLFNLFVWFELMTASAVALCGYKVQESAPLQGALNFAVTNTVGAFLTLTGIAFLYSMTGSLNFAGISAALHAHPPDRAFLALAFTFTIAGFLVKAAAFPFHFWLADAHAVAPTPVCVLFSGIMVELGLYAIARVYFGVFMPVLEPFEPAVQAVLLTIGTVTAVVGAVECFLQHHLKRLLAFSTVSHAGLMLMALGTVNAAGLTGLLLYIAFHGLLKAALFICAGILLHRFGSLDEEHLHGKGKEIAGVGVLMIVGALGLMSLPPFGTFVSDAFIHHAMEERHASWATWIFIGAGAVTGGAVIRLALRVFFGVGVRATEAAQTPKEELRETVGAVGRVPMHMWGTAAAALVLCIGLAWIPGLGREAEARARVMTESHIFAEKVVEVGTAPAVVKEHAPDAPLWPSLIALAVAAALVGSALSPRTRGALGAVQTVWKPLHALQSGRMTDYVAWLVLGIAGWGAFLLFQMM